MIGWKVDLHTRPIMDEIFQSFINGVLLICSQYWVCIKLYVIEAVQRPYKWIGLNTMGFF